MTKLFQESKGNLTNEQLAQREDAKKEMFEYSLLETEPPNWLPPSAKSEWERIVPLLKEDLPLAETDYSLLVSYCALFSRVRTCEGDIRKYGHFITNEEAGTKKANPAVAMQSQAIRDMKSIATSLCMTLEARSKMALNNAKGKEKDAFESLMLE